MSDSEESDMGDLFEELEMLEDTVDTSEERKKVRDVMSTAMKIKSTDKVFGRVITGFDRGDIAEALLGSVLFGVPMFVEGGTQEVGSFIARHPVYLFGTAIFGITMVFGILYVADIQEVKIHKPIFGVIPRRPIGVILTASITATVLMTMWGRIDWNTPYIAISNIIVAFVPMSIGGALGDILPGD